MYITKKEREIIISFIDKNIVPALNQRDLDYDKVIGFVCSETHSSKDIVEDLFSIYFPNRIKLIKTITLPDDRVLDWLGSERKRIEDNDREIKQALKEATNYDTNKDDKS